MVLEGQATVVADDDEREAGPGTFIRYGSEVRRTVTNGSDANVRLLLIGVPGDSGLRADELGLAQEAQENSSSELSWRRSSWSRWWRGTPDSPVTASLWRKLTIALNRSVSEPGPSFPVVLRCLRCSFLPLLFILEVPSCRLTYTRSNCVGFQTR